MKKENDTLPQVFNFDNHEVRTITQEGQVAAPNYSLINTRSLTDIFLTDEKNGLNRKSRPK